MAFSPRQFSLPYPAIEDEDTARKVVSQLHLPLDYFEHVKNAVDVASRFTKPLTLSQFSEEFTNMISSLNSVIQMVDDAIPYCEVDDFNIAYLSCVLHAQVVALHLRYTILHNSGDLDRCVYLSDVSSQFWDHGDRLLLNHDACTDSICLWSWAHLDTTSLQAALESSSESSQRRVTGSFFCFVARAVRTAQGLSESSNSCDLSYQARIIKDLDDIATAVDTLTPHFDHDVRLLAQLLLCQGNALLAQFELSEDLTSLDRAIPVLEIALSLCDPTYSYDRNLISDALANALAKRYSGSQDSEDLDCVIKHAEARLLEAQDASLLRRIMVSRELASHLSYRFSDTGNPEDGDRVLQLCEETLLYITDEDYRTWSVIRGDVLLNQSSCGRRVADLAESLTYIHVAFDEIDASMVGAFLLFQLKIAVVSDDQERIDKLEQEMRDIWGKGDTIVHYYRFSKDSDTSLDTAIEVFRARFQASLSDDDPIRRQSSALMLMNMLYERFLRSHRPEDPRDALSIRSLSGMGPLGMYCIDINLLDVVNRDLDPIGMEERLTEALKVRRAQDYTLCGSCAVDFPHKGRESRRNMRNADMFFPFSFAMKPGSSTIQLQDLDSVRAKLLRSLSKATDLHQRRQDLSTLVDIHLLQYNRMHDFKDLDKAGDYLQDLVDGLDDDDESWDACNWRTNWAQMVFVRAGREGAPDKPKLLRALDQLMFVAKDTRHLFHHDRLITLQAWFKALVYAWEERNMHTLEMCELGLSLLEQQSWVASNTRLSIDTRFMVQDLLTTAVVTTLLADPDHLPRVIEILDAGQSLLWNQAARLREPLDKLASVDPKLASRFAQIMTSPAKTMDASKPYNWQLYEDRNKILEEIRVIPNFENFLKPRLFEDLIMASFEGPVVILLPSRLQCVSVILSMGRSTTLSLPISVATLRKMHGVLRVAVKTRGGTGTSGEDDISVSDSEWEELDTSIAGSSRSLRRQKGVKKLDMDDVLEQLWHGVAEPVIKGVLKQSIGPKGKEKAFSKPEYRDRTRLWWCCTGEFSFMPVHAAGVYGSSPISVSDFFVSSYTPSLGALLDARARPTPTEIKILAAIQPNPRSGWSYLPEVKKELEEIVQSVPPEHLLHLGDLDRPDFDGTHTTVKNVIDKLPEAGVLHLACHGTQDMADPLSSGFILANGERLTVEELIKHRFPNAHTAILSACHTASNDTEQPDESVNLASAMLFLGFQSILATKWPMYDADGPVIARAVYHKFFQAGGNNVSLDFSSVMTSLAKGFALVMSDPLSESDFDAIARDVVLPSALRGKPFTREVLRASIREIFPMLTAEPVLESDVELIEEVVCELLLQPPLFNFSLPHVVDDIVRYLRDFAKLPPSRWATFIHMGA